VSGQPFRHTQACRRPCGVRASPLAITRHRLDWLAVWLSVHDQRGRKPARYTPACMGREWTGEDGAPWDNASEMAAGSLGVVTPKVMISVRPPEVEIAPFPDTGRAIPSD
jgi:hypothetical protein